MNPKDSNPLFPYHSTSQFRVPKVPGEYDRLTLIASRLDLFRNPAGLPYAVTPDENTREVFPVRSAQCRDWLRYAYCRERSEYPKPHNLRRVIAEMETRARHEPVRFDQVRHRHCGFRSDTNGFEAVVLDWADSAASTLEITAEGTFQLTEPNSNFHRPRLMSALPKPRMPLNVPDYLANLRRLLRPASGRDFHRLLAWAICSLHPTGPYPVLVLHGGPQVHATARLLKAAIDPMPEPLIPFPESESKLRQAAEAHHILAFHRIHRITGRRATTLVRLSEALRKPAIVQLHRHDDSRNPVVGDRDLAPYCLTVELEPAPPEAGDDLEWPALLSSTPELLGLLCRATSTALARLSGVESPVVPRLKPAARWTLAAAETLRITPADITAAFQTDQNSPPQPIQNTDSCHSDRIKPSESGLPEPSLPVPPGEPPASVTTTGRSVPESSAAASVRPRLRRKLRVSAHRGKRSPPSGSRNHRCRQTGGDASGP